MGPFDWIRQKTQQGLGEIGQGIKTVGGDIGGAIATIKPPSIPSIHIGGSSPTPPAPTNTPNGIAGGVTVAHPPSSAPLNPATDTGMNHLPAPNAPSVKPYTATINKQAPPPPPPKATPPNFATQVIRKIPSEFANRPIVKATEEAGRFVGQQAAGLASIPVNLVRTDITDPITNLVKGNNTVSVQHNPFLQATEPAANELSTAIVAPSVEKAAAQSARETTNILLPAYSQYPGGAALARAIGSQNQQEMLSRLLGTAGFTPNTPTSSIALSTGINALNATSPLMLAALPDQLGTISTLAGKAAISGGSKVAQSLHDAIQNLPNPVRTAMNTASSDKPVLSVPIKNITPTDTSGYGELDRNTVNAYKSQLQNGRPPEPLLIMESSDGKLFVEDGKHRLAAMNEAGYRNVPVRIVTPEDIHAIAQGGYVGGPKAASFDDALLNGKTFAGADNKIRFEGDDSRATVTPPSDRSATLGQVLNHPTLFNDYPQLQGVNVAVINPKNERLYGGYKNSTNTIYLNQKILDNPDLLKQTVLHETQHAIQNIEGFSGGTTSKAAGNVNLYRQNPGEQEASQVGNRINLSPQERTANPFQVRVTPRQIMDVRPPDSNMAAYLHFTDPEAATKLEAGEPFDYSKTPIHGMRGAESPGEAGTSKLVDDGKPALYLSKDDKVWSIANRPVGKPEYVNLDSAKTLEDIKKLQSQGIRMEYDYNQQKYVGIKQAISQQKLKGVDYDIAPTARTLVIDSPEKLTQISRQLGTDPSVPDFWTKLRQNYDVVDIDNVRQYAGNDGWQQKFFRAAKADQKIVLNPDVAYLKSRPPEALKAITIAKQVSENPEPTHPPSVRISTPENKPTVTPIAKTEAVPPVRKVVSHMSDEELASLSQRAPESVGSILSSDAYARTFGIPKQQAEEELRKAPEQTANLLQRNADAERAALDELQRPGSTRDSAVSIYREQTGANETRARIAVQRAAKDAGIALKPNERGENPRSFTLPEVKPGDYAKARSNPQIVRSLIENRGLEAIRAVRSLNKTDKLDFWHAVERGTPTGNSKLDTAIQKWRDLADTVHATDTGSGGTTPYIKNYGMHNWDLSDPKDLARYEQIAREQGFTLDPYNYSGINNLPRVFKSVEEGEAAGFHLKNQDPSEDITEFTQSASMRIGDQALAKGFAEADAGIDKTMKFNVRPGTNMDVSEKAMKELQGYERTGDINGIHRLYRTANRKLKQDILSLSLFHPNNINFFQVFPTLLAEGHPILAFKSLGSYPALVSKGLVSHEIEGALNDGTIEAAARIGTPIRWGSDYSSAGKLSIGKEGFGERAVFEQSVPYAHIQMVRAVLSDLTKKGVDLDSPEARDAGLAVNKIMGFINREVQNGNPHAQGLVSDIFFAPQFTRSKWSLLKDALTKPGVAGSYARRAVLGKYLMQVGVALAAGAALHQGSDSLKDLLIRNLISPSVPTGSKDEKGTNVELAMPQNFISEALALGATLKRGSDGHLSITFDPTQIPANIANYGRNRLAVLPATGLKIATNTNYSNKPLYDPNATPGTKAIQIATNAVNSVLPISLQGVVGTGAAKRILPQQINQAIQVNNPNTSLTNSLLSSLAFTPKPDKTTGYSLQSGRYFDAATKLQNALNSGKLSTIDGTLKDVTPQEGQYWMNQYLSMHPKNTKDLTTGQTIPRNWNALSNEQKASYYLSNDQQTGQQQLSPLFYIDKKLSSMDPTRPHDPLFDLSGTGTGVNGKAAPKSQIALDYTNLTTGDPQRSIILQANPWLKQYETSVANYAQNYTTNMTDYMKQSGWSDSAIQQFWSQHPSNTPPLQPPAFDTTTQNVMNQYQAMTDPTQRAQFFAANANTLTKAFDDEAQYVNQKRLASGNLALQGYPAESQHVTQILNSMPRGTDSASKATRGQLIKNNPDVEQYLADIGLYDTTKNLSGYLYQNPAHPGLNEGQLLNLGGTLAQKTLKDISNLGAYDIGKNPATGVYSFMQNGQFPAGTTPGGAGGGSQKKPLIPLPPKRRLPHKRSVRRARLAKERAKTIRVHKTTYAPIRIRHAGPLQPVKIGR